MTFKPSRITPAGIIGRVVAPAAASRFNERVQELRIAVTHRYQKDGEWVDSSTTFLTYTAADAFGEPLKTFGTGDLVEITGDWNLETREYDRNDGGKGMAVTVRFGSIALLEAKGAREEVPF